MNTGDVRAQDQQLVFGHHTSSFDQLHDPRTHPTPSTIFAHSNLLSTSQITSSFTIYPRDEHSTLEAESHQTRLAIQASIASGKGTEVAYSRHVKNYEDWWVQDQGRRMSEDSQWKEIPAHPITAAKVSIFLRYETSRPKKSADGKDISGTRVGRSSLSQCLSALEQWRCSHQHEDNYKKCPESHLKLRDDHRIKTFEIGARATEPERVAESQELKANGVLNDTYNDQEQLIRTSIWQLSQGQTAAQIHKYIRDHSMSLTTTSVAFRGDNLRQLLWSDLLCRDIPIPEIGPDFKALAVVFLSYQGKTNTEGRIDEQACFRHRIPELCCIGALSFYFFSQFHIMEENLPSFEPDFKNGSKIGLQKLESTTALSDNWSGHEVICFSIWIDSCAATHMKHGNIHSSTTEHILRTIFYKFCRFLALPILLVCVYDGADRPVIKRGRKVDPRQLESIPAIKLLAEGFGYKNHDAPAEAEAELAKLNALGIIDAIISTDSDCFAFGALSLLIWPDKRDLDKIELYTADAAENSDNVKLKTGGFILIGLLSGGDYGPGISGCGAKTAHGLAQVGFGDELIEGATSLSDADFHTFLDGWRYRLREELCENTHGCLAHRQANLATKISSSFPDLDILKKYTHPVTSWSHGNLPDTSSWKIREPVIYKLAEFCTTRLRWVQPGIDIRRRFESKLWEGVFAHMLFSAQLMYDSSRKLFLTPFTQARVIEVVGKPKQKFGLTCLRVKISTENFVRLMGTSTSWPDIKEQSIADSSLRLWVPEHLFEEAIIRQNASPSISIETPAAMHRQISSTSRLEGGPISTPKQVKHLGFFEINSDSESGDELESSSGRQSVISITDTGSVASDRSVIYISD